MHQANIGWYDGRNRAAVWVRKGDIRAVYGQKPEYVRAEFLDNMIIMTSPHEPSYQRNPDYYLED